VLFGKALGKELLPSAILSALGADFYFFFRNGLCRELPEQALGKEFFLSQLGKQKEIKFLKTSCFAERWVHVALGETAVCRASLSANTFFIFLKK